MASPPKGRETSLPIAAGQDCSRQVGPSCSTMAISFEEATLFEVVLKRFDNPDAVRTFERGKFELIRIGEMAIGRGTYGLAGYGRPTWDEYLGRKDVM